MNNFLGLPKKGWKLWAIICVVITLPFLLGSITGGLKNESAIGLIPFILSGFPWIFIYLYLPFDIPGFTSVGIPNAQGDLVVSPLHVFLIALPTYINLYLLLLIIFFVANKYKKGSVPSEVTTDM